MYHHYFITVKYNEIYQLFIYNFIYICIIFFYKQVKKLHINTYMHFESKYVNENRKIINSAIKQNSFGNFR